MGGTTKNYLVFSDVHLGAELVEHARPWTVPELRQLARVDRQLGAMLEWYRARPDPEHAWCLVIAGDLVDFIGMSVAPARDETLETVLTNEEREHGLGSACDHAAWKMKAVARRHAHVFEKLAAFVADGHTLVLVRGNHDLDFHWDTARRAFVDALVDALVDQGGVAPEDFKRRREFESRIEFHPWFYYVEGLLYVEHGHQWDALCNYRSPLVPISPMDSRRLDWSFTDLLMRYVVRPTPGLSVDAPDQKTLAYYVRFGLSLGLMGAARLFSRLIGATLHGLRIWRAQWRAAARELRVQHERRIGELADIVRVGRERLGSLAAAWPRPLTDRWASMLRLVFLDRIVAGALGITLAVLALLLVPDLWWLPVSLVAVLSTAGFFAWSHRERSRDVSSSAGLRRGALCVAELMPSRWVVMGHTHDPAMVELNAKTTYVNVGNWGRDALDSGVGDASRTHLVIRWKPGGPIAELFRWDSKDGPVVVVLPTAPAR